MRSGRWWRQLVVVPHQRTQSMALHQGPLARRFRLADLVLHTTAGPVLPRVIQADAGTARALFDAQAARARAARKRQTSEHWLAQVTPLVSPAEPVALAEPAETGVLVETRDLGPHPKLASSPGEPGWHGPELDQRVSPRAPNPTQQEGPQRG